MKIRGFKKILLGSLLTSVATAATASFVINASNEKSSSQNNNTSSYKNIYKKQDKANKVGHPPKKASFQSNSAPKMTPYTTSIPKIKFHFLGLKAPSSPSAEDGEAHYYIENYNANAMEWMEHPAYEINRKGDIKNTGNYVTMIHLKAGVNFMDGFQPKSGYTWSDGTSSIIWSPSPHIINFNDNKSAKPTFTKAVKQPTTKTARDGEVTYTLTNFDPNTMDIKLAPNVNGTLGNYDSNAKTIKVTGLKVGQYTQIVVYPKNEIVARKIIPGYGVEDDNTSKANMFNSSSAPEKSVTSTLKNMNVIELNTDLKSRKSSTLNPEYADILKSSTARKHISEKFKFDNAKNKWTYNGANVETKAHAATWTLDSLNSTSSKSQSKLKVWVDSFNKSTGRITIKSQFSLSIDGGGEDNAAFTQLNLNFYYKSVHWNNENTLGVQSSKFTPYFGLKKPTFTNAVKQPTTTTSTDGEVTFTLIDFKKDKMDISLVSGSSGTLGAFDPATNTIKVSNFANGQYAQIKAIPKTHEIWNDGTRTAQTSSKVTLSQSYVGLQKISSAYTVKQPTTTTSTDGEVTYTLTNFDPNTMDISLFSGSSGTLGTYDTTHKTVKVSGLSNGQHAQIQFTPKTNEKWIDGTTTSLFSWAFTPAQTYVGLQKTTFTKVVKQPTTTTSTDGEVTFTLINFDKNKMDISLVSGSSGTLGAFDLKTNTIKVSNFANGQYAQIQTIPKTNEAWKDGTRTAQTSSKVTLSQSYAGLIKTTFTNTVIQPKTTTSTDGEVTFTLTNFDPVNMFLSTASGSNGTLGTYDPQTNTIKVTHLANGQHAQIQITLKPYISWSDGTFGVVNSPSINFVQTVAGISKTTFTNTVTQPKTTTSTDGEVTFTLTNFIQAQMNISLVSGSSGTLGAFDPATNTIKVTGLIDQQRTQIKVTLKSSSDIWVDGTNSVIKSPTVNISQTNTGLIKTTFTNTVIQPKTTTSTDGEVTFTMIYYNPARMDVSLAPGSGGTLGTFDSNNNKIKVTGLASGQHAQIKVTLKQNNIWTDGTSIVIISSSVSIIQTDVGLAKTTFTNTVTQPKTVTSTDGEATFTLTNFDGTKMDISLATGSSGDLGSFDTKTNTIQVTHLSNGQHTQIQVTLKVQHIWVDGTSSVLNSPLIRMNQSSVGLAKTTFTNTVTQPKTTTSTDGEVTFTLTNFDGTKMDISLVPGSNGTLGAFDPQTKKIKVTGVAVGQHAQIQVAPKTNNLWVDGTTTPQKSSTFKPAQTFVGLKKTTFTNTVTQPKTTTSTDGEVIFTLTNFNPITMNLSVAFGSNGTLGTYDPKTKKVKVTHLSNGQHAQIQVTLKSTSDIWDDGKILPVKSTSVTISQQQLGITIPTTKHQSIQPTTTTSTDGEVTFTLTNFEETKMDISLAPGSSGNLGTFDPQTNAIKVTNLMHGQHAQIQFTLKPTLIWSDGTTTPAKSFKIRIQHNSSWLKKVEISSVVSTPTTKTSKDGSVIFKLKNFHPSKMSVDFAKNSNGSIGEYDPENDTLEIIGLANGEYVQVEVSLKGDQAWSDGTDEPIKSKKIQIIESGIKLVKIVKKKFTQPTGATTGTIILTLEKYDSNNIIASLKSGSHGSIAAYNPQTKQIQITGLQKNEKVEIEFSLKPNNNATGSKNWWENGTDEPQQKVFYMGYNKISLDNVELLVPTKAGSNDGQITFNIPGFNPATMEVKLLKGSNGVLGKFDPKNNKIKVSELKIGESAQIKIFLKDKTLIWSDGSSQQIESTKIKIPASYTTDPSTSSSNQGGMSKLLLVGIVIGSLIVVNVGWIGMYKIMKSKRNLF